MVGATSALVGGVALAFAIGLPQPASALGSVDGPTASEFNIDPTSGVPGSEIGISGTCLVNGAPADRATVVLAYDTGPETEYAVTQSIAVQEDGAVSGAFSIPLHAPGGEYVLTARCVIGDASLPNETFEFTVTGADPPQGKHVARLVVATTNVRPGSVITVTGECLLFGATPTGVELFIDRQDGPGESIRKSVPASEDGALNFEVNVPEGTPAGEYALLAGCEIDTVSFGRISIPIRISLPADDGPEGPVLPNTGINAPGILGPLGLSLVFAGSAAIAFSRRKSHC